MNLALKATRPQGEKPIQTRWARTAAKLDAPIFGAIGLAMVVGIVHFTVRQAWLPPLARDLNRWLRSPTVSGGWQVPYGWQLVILVLAVALVDGWLLSAIALDAARLADNAPIRMGLSVVVAFAIIGYTGMLGVALGVLDAAALALALIVISAGCAVAWLTLGRPALWPRKAAAGQRSLLAWIGWPTVAAVIGFSIVHAAMAPVTEWDAVIYHAGTAKLWFLGRPNPPLLYGPSVGVEISANYPPIFPAIGAALTTLVGRFDDSYLRLTSPIMFAGLLSILFGWARQEGGERTAWLAMILTVGCPLLVMYGAWTTAYMLLSALTVSVLLLSYLAGRTQRTVLWVIAGLVAGLALLSHFYGWLVLGFGLFAVLIWDRSRRGWVRFGLFAGVALLTASPWLIRNFVYLHDPVYPLGSPIFHGIGLIQPLWSAAQEEIRQNALGQFGGANVKNLRFYELGAAMFSRHFLPLGLVAPLIFSAWRALKKDGLGSYLGLAVVMMLAVQLAPGWYWIRSLVPALSIAAFIGALLLNSAMGGYARSSARWKRVAQVSVWAGVSAIVGVSSVVGGMLALAGPNQDTWTTGLTGSHDMTTALRNLGSDQKQLWTVYGGDFLCWQWLNARTGPRDKIATLDLRLYYFDRPQNLFYLDGLEAVPLLKMHDISEVAGYLRSEHVKFIMIPAWAVAATPSRHPAVDLLPLMKMLGTPTGFPVAAVFAPAGSNVPTVVYDVDQQRSSVFQPAVFPGSSAPIPKPDASTFRLLSGTTDPRIYAPTAATGEWSLQFMYDDGVAGRFDLNLFDYARNKWQTIYSQVRTGSGGWESLSIRLPSSPQGWVDLGVYAAGGDLTIRDVRITELQPGAPG